MSDETSQPEHSRPLPRKRFSTGDGCGFLVATCFVTCCFLAINGTLARVAFLWLAPLGPDWIRRPRAEQVIMFAAPLLMVVAEWWLVDRIVDQISSTSDNGKPGQD